MKKSNYIICVVVLLAFIMLGRWEGLAPSNTLGQDSDIPQLVGEDVLRILAIPLPESINRGYFLVNVDISEANLTGVNLNRAQLDFSNFSNTDINFGQLIGVSANHVDFSNASLADANFDDGTFSYSVFNNANLTNASLRRAVLADANFVSAIFMQADLQGASLLGSDISNASFSGAILNDTTLPDGSIYEIGRDLVEDFGAASNP